MKPLISVIIPVYNIEKHLKKSIDSICNQTYKNIEILLINDGSTDNSGKICDELQAADNRIKVIHKKNGGVAAARNTGIENMTGEFYCFVDGDDIVHPDYILQMYQLINEHNADISMCAYLFAWADGRKLRTRNNDYADNHIFEDTGKNAMNKMLYSKIYAPACWGKLFRTNKTTVHFPAYAIGEDFLASIHYLTDAEKIIMTNEPLYYYMQNDESVMHSVNPDKIFDMVITGDEMMKIISEKCPENKTAAAYYIIEKNLMALMKIYGIEGQDDKIKHISENIRKYRKTVILDSNAELRTRIACVISYFGINTLCKIRNKITK